MTDEEKKIKKQEALKDYNEAKNSLKKSNNIIIKRVLIIASIIFTVCLLVRIFYGRIYFSVSFLRLNKSVEYKMFVNGKHKTVAFEDTEDSPIIPGLLYFRRENRDAWFNMDELNEDLIFEDEKIKLDFVVSECYTHTDKIRVNCESSNDKLIHKKVKTKFKTMFIRKNGGKNKVMYDGKYISDISQYVKEKGYYYIEISAEYDGIDTKLYLFPRRKESLDENNNLQ